MSRPRSIRYLTVVACAVTVVLSACGSNGSSTSSSTSPTTAAPGSSSGIPGLSGGSSGPAFKGDACSLLTASDFTAAAPGFTLSGTDSAGGSTFKQCTFSLQGDGDSTDVLLKIDAADDFSISKAGIRGKDISGIGYPAWRGDDGGIQPDTIGVKVGKNSFVIYTKRKLGTSDGLVSLAKTVATNLA